MVAGRYRIVSLLGRGGMGEVYRADDTPSGGPLSLDRSAWYFPRLSLVLFVIAVLAISSFVVSLGREPLFDES